jgi:hypothetical protein
VSLVMKIIGRQGGKARVVDRASGGATRWWLSAGAR